MSEEAVSKRLATRREQCKIILERCPETEGGWVSTDHSEEIEITDEGVYAVRFVTSELDISIKVRGDSLFVTSFKGTLSVRVGTNVTLSKG